MQIYRRAGIFISLGLCLSLSACGGSDNCESIIERINEIEQKLDQNPESLSKHTQELEALADKMQELKCYEGILDDTFPDQ